MLYIVNWRDQERTWRVGEHINMLDRAVLDVQLVAADGDELDYVIANMPNVPYVKHRVNRWYGEMAQFIAANL